MLELLEHRFEVVFELGTVVRVVQLLFQLTDALLDVFQLCVVGQDFVGRLQNGLFEFDVLAVLDEIVDDLVQNPDATPHVLGFSLACGIGTFDDAFVHQAENVFLVLMTATVADEPVFQEPHDDADIRLSVAITNGDVFDLQLRSEVLDGQGIQFDEFVVDDSLIDTHFITYDERNESGKIPLFNSEREYMTEKIWIVL